MNRRVIGLLSLGHLTVDVYAGVLPVLLYLLRPTLHLSYLMIGVASLLFTITSSVIQPIFGYLSDRRHIAELLPIGCVLCAFGICAASLGPSFPVLLLLIAVSGCGSALYHPEGAKTAAFFSGDQRASGMSLFSVGGSIGYACGPGAFLVLHDVVHGFAPYALFAFGLIVAVRLAMACAPLRRGVALHLATRSDVHEPVAWGVVAAVLGIVAIRGWLHMGLVFFLPYWAGKAGAGLSAGAFVSGFLFAGVVGTLAAGPLADRFGPRRVLILSIAPLTPLLFLFLAVQGIPALVVIGITGALVISSFSITVVMAQQLMTKHQGMAAGLSNGFASGIGGLGVLVTGALADHVGLTASFLTLAVLPLPAIWLALSLPASVESALRHVVVEERTLQVAG
ncbi:MAG: sugar phosphate permease [Chloroflexi bacterium]|nr:sugar phosphate permease [Chloroflexota bacterium]